MSGRRSAISAVARDDPELMVVHHGYNALTDPADTRMVSGFPAAEVAHTDKLLQRFDDPQHRKKQGSLLLTPDSV